MRVEARLAPACHFDNEHEEENEIKGPDRKEDEEPVPKDLPVQLQDQHNKEYKCEDPCQEDSLSKRHVHLKRWPKGTASSCSERDKTFIIESMSSIYIQSQFHLVELMLLLKQKRGISSSNILLLYIIVKIIIV